MRLFLKNRLAFLGAHIQMVLDGEEALAALAERHPTLILSDAVMPRMDGFELCRQVKKDPGLAAIPFLLLTSLSQNLRERSLQVGADDYLSKSENDLIFRIRMRLMLEIGLRGAPRAAEGLPAAPSSILVVSKSRAIQTQLLTHLSKDGIQVLGVSSPGEVLNHLQAKGADALLIDMEQGPDALEVLLGNLRNDPAFAAIPIMALASKAEELHLSSVELDVQDRLLKPLDGPESRHRIKLLLRLAKTTV
jgi:two-component system cell cycle response regulator